jgi:hypothetical protein
MVEMIKRFHVIFSALPKYACLLFALGLWRVDSSVHAQTTSTFRGFTHERSMAQKKYETAFKELASPEVCRRELRFLTEDPHPAGSPNSFKVAQYLFNKYQEYGLEAEIYEYKVYLPYPLEVCVEMAAPIRYEAIGKEEPWEWDKDSYEADIMPGYKCVLAGWRCHRRACVCQQGAAGRLSKTRRAGNFR